MLGRGVRRISCISAPTAWASPRSGRVPIQVLAETALDAILAAAEAIETGLLMVDSVQTLTAEGLEGPAGSVGQVREAAARLAAWSHEQGTPVSWWGM